MLAWPSFLLPSGYQPVQPQPVARVQPAAYGPVASPYGVDAYQASLEAQLEQVRGMLQQLQAQMDRYVSQNVIMPAAVAPIAPPPPPPPPA
ncbi:MAG: hypothetical protein JWM80_4169, partial [Cyanobacteria bacterium RYN_339]|nr:hypothetical protein [Cyanobacteria bacterium RYN_339]